MSKPSTLGPAVALYQVVSKYFPNRFNETDAGYLESAFDNEEDFVAWNAAPADEKTLTAKQKQWIWSFLGPGGKTQSNWRKYSQEYYKTFGEKRGQIQIFSDWFDLTREMGSIPAICVTIPGTQVGYEAIDNSGGQYLEHSCPKCHVSNETDTDAKIVNMSYMNRTSAEWNAVTALLGLGAWNEPMVGQRTLKPDFNGFHMSTGPSSKCITATLDLLNQSGITGGGYRTDKSNRRVEMYTKGALEVMYQTKETFHRNTNRVTHHTVSVHLAQILHAAIVAPLHPNIVIWTGCMVTARMVCVACPTNPSIMDLVSHDQLRSNRDLVIEIWSVICERYRMGSYIEVRFPDEYYDLPKAALVDDPK